MAIQGLRNTSNFAADERPLNWRAGISRIARNGKMPLTGLTSRMKTRAVDDPEFNWWEKEVQSLRFPLGANLTTSNTTLTLASGYSSLILKAGDMLYVEQTGELMRVTADPSDSSKVNVERGWAGTTPTALSYNGTGVNPNVLIVGSAYEEGSLAPTGVSFDPVKRRNFLQIFRDTFEGTRTAMRTRLRTEAQVNEAKRECLEIHGMKIEEAFWLGKAHETTKNGKPLRTTDGVFNFIDANNKVDALVDYPSGVTMEGLEGYFMRAFEYGSSEKVCVLGDHALLTTQQIIRKNSSFQIQTGLKEYGMNVSRITTAHGELVLMSHKLWNYSRGGTTGSGTYYGMNSWMAILDMDQFWYVHLTGSDTFYEPKLQANGLDGVQSGYTTEAGLEVHHPKAHFLIKNLHRAAVDS